MEEVFRLNLAVEGGEWTLVEELSLLESYDLFLFGAQIIRTLSYGRLRALSSDNDFRHTPPLCPRRSLL